MRNTIKITWGLTALLAILVLVNVYTTWSMADIANEFKAETEELSRAAEIEIITIIDSSCTDCFDTSAVVQKIKGANVEVTSQQDLEYSDEAAQALIEKYSLEKIPAVIVTGEINKEGSPISGLETKDDALLFLNPDPVYLELSSGDYRGRINIEIIEKEDCEECFDLSEFVSAISDVMSVSSEKTRSLEDATDLIAEYSLSEVPAVILSGDLELYPEILTKLETLGSYVGDDLILTAKLNPPYWDITSEEIKGLVSVTYLTDDACEDCYNVNIHKTVLKNYGVYIAEESTVDISSDEGQDLLKEYNITKVPTIIASADLEYYDGINEVWEGVGSIEDDGVYVFRELDLVSANYTSIEE